MSLSILFVVLVSWFFGQCLKIWLGWHHYRKINLWIFMEDGGIPSCHAVVLAALTTALLFETGFSHFFVISLVFAVIIAVIIKRETLTLHISHEIFLCQKILNLTVAETVCEKADSFWKILLARPRQCWRNGGSL